MGLSAAVSRAADIACGPARIVLVLLIGDSPTSSSGTVGWSVTVGLFWEFSPTSCSSFAG